MVDTEARKRLAGLIRSYLNEEMTAFDFDEALDEFRWDQDDETVARVAEHLWFFYDDFQDHLVVATKGEWDYIQRLVLVLESGCQFEPVRQSKRKRCIAGAALAVYCIAALWIGWNPDHLIWLSVPFGLVSAMLAFAGRDPRVDRARYEAMAPFTSLAQMVVARRRKPGFMKQRYREDIASRQIRSAFVGLLFELLSVFWTVPAWLVFSPLVLLFQALPATRAYQPLCVADPV